MSDNTPRNDNTPGGSEETPGGAPGWAPPPAPLASAWRPGSPLPPPGGGAGVPHPSSTPTGGGGSSPRVLLAIILLAAAAGLGYVFGHNTLSKSENFASGAAPGSSSGSGSVGNGSSGNGAVPGFGSSGLGSTGPGFPGFNGGSNSSTNTSPTPGAGSPTDVAKLAAGITPDLVDISSTFSYQSAAGEGTGIVIGSNGVVLTNNHVIEGATAISVTDLGNHRTYKATVLGYDWSHDIAVLKLTGASGLKVAPIASGTATVGEGVVAVGNAGGLGGTPTAAGGSITKVDQSISASDDLTDSSEQLTGLLEVNADVQAGDSGGSLINSAGKVVGVDTAASVSYSFENSGGQGYAIPIATAMKYADAIRAGKSSATTHVGPTAFLGVETSAVELNPYGFGSQPGTSSGAEVRELLAGEPAEKAGIEVGDVITGLGGAAVTSPASLVADLVPYHPGQKVVLTWVDTSGTTHSQTITLASGPAQ